MVTVVAARRGWIGTKLRFFPKAQPGPFDDLPRAEMPGRRETKELEACLGRAADYDPMYLEGTGGFPSDGASETPQPLPARSMASPDCDLLEPKAGDQRAATLIRAEWEPLEARLAGLRSRAVEPPPTAAGGEAFERANLAKSCAAHA